MAKLNQICINGDCSETPNAFSKVDVDGTVLSADSNDDTLNVEAGTNITLTPNIASDTVEISAPNVYNKTEVDNLISGVGGLKYVKDVDPNKGVVANHVTGNTASGSYAFAEGNFTTASGDYSHSEGNNTHATGSGSHAEGSTTTASGVYSHAEGDNTRASGRDSHAEGNNTDAFAVYSHAEGYQTKAGTANSTGGTASHAEGGSTTASGDYSHAEGSNTYATGIRSHAEGQNTIANGENQHVQGKFNEPDNNNVYAHIVGNGTTNANRSNAYALKWTGASTQKAAVEIQDMFIPQTTPAPADGYYGVHNDVAYRIVDSSGNTVGYLTDFFTNSRGRGVQLSVERTVEGEVLNNDLTLGIDDNGEATVEVTDGDAWTGAIGAVKKSGDTMTGHLKLQSSNINENTTPSSNQWGNAHYQLLSTNGTRAAYWELGQLTDGKIGFEIGALRVVNGSNTYNTLNMYVTPTGENFVAVSSPVAWRSALGLAWNTFVKVQEFTKAGVSTSAGSTRDYTFSVTLSGYTPIGIVGTRITSGGTTTLTSTYLSGTSVTVRVRNNGTSAQTPEDVRIQVLFIINA